MTLLEIATFVCSKVGQTDDASLAACKGFLTARHNMVWDAHLWRDSVTRGTVSVVANQQFVLAPRDMAHVLAVRENTGKRVLGYEDQELDFLLNPEQTDTADTACRFSQAGSAVAVVSSIVGPTADLTVLSNDASTTGKQATFALEISNGTDSDGAVVTRVFDLTTNPQTVNNVTAVLSVSKSVTTSQFEITLGGTVYYIMLPAETEAFRRARIRLSSPNLTAVDLLIVGKRYPNAFNLDTHLPSLPMMDNALIAFAQGDMLERKRQYAKAQVKFNEAGLQVSSMWDRERQQAQRNMRIVPTVEPMDSMEWANPTKSNF